MSIKPHIVLPTLAALALLLSGCSTEKNTAKSRWWHSFNARYNVYYNGNVAYVEGSLEKENGNRDNYTELIPLYTVGNRQSRELGKAQFDKAIEKAQKAIKLHSIKRRPVWDKNRRKTARDLEWLGRREYNPFLWKAWMLMGRAQFHQGDFDGAASTFSYMSRLYETQPAIYGRARAWLAKSYVENGFLYDAEDVIRNMERDSIHWRAQKEWDYTYADYYIHSGDYAKAIPYLKKVIRHEMRKKQKAREYFLLGQLEAALGHSEEAYQAYRSVIRLNPPYTLEFNARIAQTEVMAGKQGAKMISKLRRMAASDKNTEYLDQVYYALGNIYLSQRDTAQAIASYERGNAKATRSGIEKGVLLLKLGDLYWEQQKYADAQRCYGEAIGLLDRERKDYEQLSQRSRVLDELVPHTEAIHLQDSLQTLAAMNERDRNAAIDRVIEALKRKEKEERNLADEQTARQTMQQNGGRGNVTGTPTRPVLPNQQSGAWYFYNPTAVQQGKMQFERLWGKRQNVDNWQRNNQTVVAGMGMHGGMESFTEAQRDSMARAEAAADSLRFIADSAQNDPHKREYYLAQIPFTAEQVEASNLIIMDALYNSGVIFKDKLDNLPLSEKALLRLTGSYPTFAKMDEAYYHLFLLFSRKGEHQAAAGYIDRLKAEYPGSKWTQILTDPYFAQNAREGAHLEDSLYAATYEAFRAGRLGEVAGNAAISESRFPLGANRDKFIFIGALAKLNSGDGEGCVAGMRNVVENFPQSALAEMAGMVVNGVNAGRRLRGGNFDLGNVWERRTVVLADSDSLKARTLTNERNTNFVFMLVYRPDSVNQNKLLFELARYNFTSYLVRSFDIGIEEADGLNRMQVRGFRSYDEALQYARQLLGQQGVTAAMGKARPVIISEENLPLLGTNYSYDEYARFYDKHFAPLKVSTFHLLTEPADVVTQPETKAEPEVTESEIDNFLNDTYVAPEEPAAPVTPATPTIPMEQEVPTVPQEPAVPTIPTVPEVPAMPAMPTVPTVEPEPAVPARPTTNTFPIDDPTTPQPQAPTSRSQQAVPSGQTNRNVPAQNPRPTATPTPATPATPAPSPVGNGTYIPIDEMDTIPASKARPRATTRRTPTQPANTPKPKAPATKAPAPQTTKKTTENKGNTYDLEDEYYDLEGF